LSPGDGDAVVALRKVKLPRVRLSFFPISSGLFQILFDQTTAERTKKTRSKFLCFSWISASLMKPDTPISWVMAKPYPQLIGVTRNIFKKVTQTLFAQKNAGNPRATNQFMQTCSPLWISPK
jgi:hypothetical protein